MTQTVGALSGAIIGGAVLAVVALVVMARRRRYTDEVEVGIFLLVPVDDDDDQDDDDDDEDEDDDPPPAPPPVGRLAESGGWAAIGSVRVHTDCARNRRDGHHGDICHGCRPFLVGPSGLPTGGAA